MPHTNTEAKNSHSVPTVLYGGNAANVISLDEHALADTMQELGIPEKAIGETTIYMDPRARLISFGTHYPNKLGRLRLRKVPGIKDATGDIIRLSTKMVFESEKLGRDTNDSRMNRIAVHELEHVAQQERHDRKLNEGHIAIWGLAAAGAVIGNRLGRTKKGKALGTAVGGYVGHSIGYMIAPHERQARARARQVKSTAIKRT